VSAVRVGAVVLAAGLSRRMGRSNKLARDVAGVPMIGRVVDAVLASDVAEVVVVTGHQPDAVRCALAACDVRFVHNADYRRGMGGSIAVGVCALSADVDAVLICLGDMPHVRARHIDPMLRAFDASPGHTICAPVYASRRGHPVLFGARHFAELRALSGDSGAHRILEAHAAAICEVVVNDAGVTRDVDTPEELVAAQGVSFENPAPPD